MTSALGSNPDSVDAVLDPIDQIRIDGFGMMQNRDQAIEIQRTYSPLEAAPIGAPA